MPRTILVVDDDEALRLTTSLLLEAAGYAVETAANGNEALEKIQSRAFDAVVTDLLMPDRDGLELIGELRRKQPALPIIAVSGGGQVSGDQYLAMAGRLGARKVLSKPFTGEDLAAAVAAVLA